MQVLIVKAKWRSFTERHPPNSPPIRPALMSTDGFNQ